MGKASEGSYCVLLIVIVGIDPNLTRKYPARTAAFHGQDKLKSAVFMLRVYILLGYLHRTLNAWLYMFY